MTRRKFTGKKADEGWSGKNVPLSSIPPYKAPRQRKQTLVDITETEEKASDSEEDTQFVVVWEKIKEVETLPDKPVTGQNKTRKGYVSPPQLQMMSEREAQEVSQPKISFRTTRDETIH
jgi:hypothetical protein